MILRESDWSLFWRNFVQIQISWNYIYALERGLKFRYINVEYQSLPRINNKFLSSDKQDRLLEKKRKHPAHDEEESFLRKRVTHALFRVYRNDFTLAASAISDAQRACVPRRFIITLLFSLAIDRAAVTWIIFSSLERQSNAGTAKFKRPLLLFYFYSWMKEMLLLIF